MRISRLSIVKLVFPVTAFTIFLSGFCFAGDDLPARYHKWLYEEVVYIVTQQEKEAFLKLESNELRDRFIEIFWERRDPTPGTRKNEMKDEHYRRIKFANDNFGPRGRDTGWRTERGRVYIMLGEPKERKEYANNAVVYPLELWFYSADGRIPGVSFFYLVFYKRGGAGEYEIYHPHIDVPEALTAHSGIRSNPQMALTYLNVVDAELSRAAISLNPLDPGGSLSSEVLLGKIDNYPETAFDGSWATEFLESKGQVDVTYSFKPLDVNYTTLVFAPPDGPQELHYGFMLKPEDIEVGQYEEEHFSAFEIIPTIATKEGTIIFEHSTTAEFGWSREEYDKYKTKPILFADVAPVIAGEYNFTLRIRNKVSRTYFYFTRPVEVPEPADSKFVLSNLLLSYDYEKSDETAGLTSPFRFFNVQYMPSSTNEFAEFENVHVFFQLFFPVPSASDTPVGDIKFEFNIYSGDEPVKNVEHLVTRDRLNEIGVIYMSRQLPLAGLSDGDYRLEIKAYDNLGGFAVARSALFAIRQPEYIPRPIILPLHSKVAMTDAEMRFLRAKEYLTVGQVERGHAELREVLETDPENLEAALLLSESLLMSGKFDEAYEAARLVERVEPNRRQLVLLLARASVGRGNSSKAIGYFERLLFLNPNDVEALNEVADIYLQTGQKDKARERLAKSLEVKPDQPKIQGKLDRVDSQ